MVHIAALAAAALPASAVAETVLGAYIFSRHGDRTAKKTPPTSLTDLGYTEVFQSGQYFNSRYVNNQSAQHILELMSQTVRLSQLSVSAPQDNVLINSATGFLQGLYPPVGTDASIQVLRNGFASAAPLNGYQLIPLTVTSSGSRSEDNAWLQEATGCANAQISSNQYFSSPEYSDMLQSTEDFYQRLYPVVNQTFTMSDMSYKNAYTIFDLINVALIHNATIQSYDLIEQPKDTVHQLLTLANAHEFGLAYNASSQIRAIAGMTLAADVVDFLNGTINGGGKQKLGIQFGPYGTFMSFFGLAQLAGKVNGDDFYGIADYAASMTFELYTDADTATYPTNGDDLRVRFFYNNGTTTVSDAPVNYPLFGQQNLNISWPEFVSNMAPISVSSPQQWCSICGNTTGTCAQYQPGADASSASSAAGSSHAHGMSLAVAGVIGAMVTLAVIAIVEGLVLLVGGLAVVKRRRGGVASSDSGSDSVVKA